ncbi:MAG: hypothetical protein NC930_09495, partial [Candidatus Omnitrophica bacterium]|nr:hypothetical protein [Candidatus Omnitrophota bacterium]
MGNPSVPAVRLAQAVHYFRNDAMPESFVGPAFPQYPTQFASWLGLLENQERTDAEAKNRPARHQYSKGVIYDPYPDSRAAGAAQAGDQPVNVYLKLGRALSDFLFQTAPFIRASDKDRIKVAEDLFKDYQHLLGFDPSSVPPRFDPNRSSDPLFEAIYGENVFGPEFFEFRDLLWSSTATDIFRIRKSGELEPGNERTERFLKLREWLSQRVALGTFPPEFHGHIKRTLGLIESIEQNDAKRYVELQKELNQQIANGSLFGFPDVVALVDNLSDRNMLCRKYYADLVQWTTQMLLAYQVNIRMAWVTSMRSQPEFARLDSAGLVAELNKRLEVIKEILLKKPGEKVSPIEGYLGRRVSLVDPTFQDQAIVSRLVEDFLAEGYTKEQIRDILILARELRDMKEISDSTGRYLYRLKGGTMEWADVKDGIDAQRFIPSLAKDKYKASGRTRNLVMSRVFVERDRTAPVAMQHMQLLDAPFNSGILLAEAKEILRTYYKGGKVTYAQAIEKYRDVIKGQYELLEFIQKRYNELTDEEKKMPLSKVLEDLVAQREKEEREKRAADSPELQSLEIQARKLTVARPLELVIVQANLLNRRFGPAGMLPLSEATPYRDLAPDIQGDFQSFIRSVREALELGHPDRLQDISQEIYQRHVEEKRILVEELLLDAMKNKENQKYQVEREDVRGKVEPLPAIQWALIKLFRGLPENEYRLSEKVMDSVIHNIWLGRPDKLGQDTPSVTQLRIVRKVRRNQALEKEEANARPSDQQITEWGAFIDEIDRQIYRDRDIQNKYFYYWFEETIRELMEKYPKLGERYPRVHRWFFPVLEEEPAAPKTSALQPPFGMTAVGFVIGVQAAKFSKEALSEERMSRLYALTMGLFGRDRARSEARQGAEELRKLFGEIRKFNERVNVTFFP